MIDEIGVFCLVAAFVLSLAQAGVAALGQFKGLRGLARISEGLSLAAAASIVIAFAVLILAFVRSDFSVVNVFEHSHTDKPLLYKISGAWGSHEGSMLLWCTILLVYGAMITLKGTGLPDSLKHKALGVQGALGAAFVGFTLFSSNPLGRLARGDSLCTGGPCDIGAPIQGQSLNPALQDPALAFHPPMLYLGYVGFSVVFSFAVAALIEGRLDRAWARWIRPWVLLAWSFLTVGITLGAFWAYYELGWGGWWAWDPVENASFMPWLAATALLHSAIVMEKRDALKAWTVFLSLLAFSFAMMGAFLVRSGLLTSVHAFAIDPQRGILLASILFVTAGSGFALFAWRAPALSPGGLFAPISREAALVVNNLLISAALSSVFLGTLYPILMQAMFDRTMSVGAPYYLSIFAPIMVAALALVPISTLMAWKRAELKGIVQRLGLTFGLALLVAAVGSLTWKGTSFLGEVAFFVGIAIAAWLVFGSVKTLLERTGTQGFWRRFTALPLSFHGMTLAHIGLGLFVLGAVVESHERSSATGGMDPGGSLRLGHYELTLRDVTAHKGKNYDAQTGLFDLSDDKGHIVCRPKPEYRYYPASDQPQSKVALCFSPFDDYYVVLNPSRATGPDAPQWAVRFFVNPMVRLVFFGPLLMALGGALSLADRRLRLGVPAKARGGQGEK